MDPNFDGTVGWSGQGKACGCENREGRVVFPLAETEKHPDPDLKVSDK